MEQPWGARMLPATAALVEPATAPVVTEYVTMRPVRLEPDCWISIWPMTHWPGTKVIDSLTRTVPSGANPTRYVTPPNESETLKSHWVTVPEDRTRKMVGLVTGSTGI